MTPEERYLFDLQGFLFIPEAISQDLVQQMNDDIDKMEALNDEEAAKLGIARKYHENKGGLNVGEYAHGPYPILT